MKIKLFVHCTHICTHLLESLLKSMSENKDQDFQRWESETNEVRTTKGMKVTLAKERLILTFLYILYVYEASIKVCGTLYTVCTILFL